MPTTRWGDAITRLLADRGWTKRQLADAASIRPNTLTNIIRHGRRADLATLARVADALKVDIAELFLTNEQSVTLHAYRENRIEHLRDLVVKELSGTVTDLVARELERVGQFQDAGSESSGRSYKASKLSGARRKTAAKKR